MDTQGFDPSIREEYAALIRRAGVPFLQYYERGGKPMGSQGSQEELRLWWQEELMRRLRDFLADPEGEADQALRDTMTRYREAVASRSVTPPLFPRVQP